MLQFIHINLMKHVVPRTRCKKVGMLVDRDVEGGCNSILVRGCITCVCKVLLLFMDVVL